MLLEQLVPFHQSEHGPTDPSFSMCVHVCLLFLHSLTALDRVPASNHAGTTDSHQRWLERTQDWRKGLWLHTLPPTPPSFLSTGDEEPWSIHVTFVFWDLLGNTQDPSWNSCGRKVCSQRQLFPGLILGKAEMRFGMYPFNVLHWATSDSLSHPYQPV